MKVGPLFPLLRSCPKKIVVLQGGGDAAKTVTALQYIAIALIENPGWIATVTAQDGPNLTGGALRNFQRYVAEDDEVAPYIRQFNKQEKTYYFQNGSILEFKAFDDEQDARGSERDLLYMNECNSRTYSLFWQLQRKTRRKVILDYNPTAPFWVHEKILPGEHQERQFADLHQLYIIDHRHNPFLTEEEHAAYESISDPELFRVYARGLTGRVQGLIYGHFRKVTGPPEQYDRIIWGIDYGYTNDPTAVVKVYVHGIKRTWKEVFYRSGDATPAEIRDAMVLEGWDAKQMVYSEADPNMINQLRVIGMPVQPAIKGPGSLIAGISKVRQHECYYYDSPNLEREISQYQWVKAKDMATGREVMTNVPVDRDNHACDAGRYADYTDSFRHR